MSSRANHVLQTINLANDTTLVLSKASVYDAAQIVEFLNKVGEKQISSRLD